MGKKERFKGTKENSRHHALIMPRFGYRLVSHFNNLPQLDLLVPSARQHLVAAPGCNLLPQRFDEESTINCQGPPAPLSGRLFWARTWGGSQMAASGGRAAAGQRWGEGSGKMEVGRAPRSTGAHRWAAASNTRSWPLAASWPSFCTGNDTSSVLWMEPRRGSRRADCFNE